VSRPHVARSRGGSATRYRRHVMALAYPRRHKSIPPKERRFAVRFFGPSGGEIRDHKGMRVEAFGGYQDLSLVDNPETGIV
jgi:hypothetical protein